MADSVRIEGQPPASDRLYVLAHQTLTFLSRKTAFAGMDALIIGFKLRQNWGNAAEKPGATETARNLMEAKRAIKETRPIVILGDGRRGDRDVVLPVCGTPMPFQPGFAMIALQFKLPVIFVDSYMDREGRLVYRFSEPLTLDETATADAQIASYIGQYAEKLEGLYREFPGMINPPHRLRFLKFRQEQSIAHTSA